MSALTAGDFLPHVGSAFPVVDEHLRLALVLTAVTPGDPPADDRLPRPFVLDLEGPQDPALAQATVPLEHPTLGTIEIFVVPVGRDARGTRYEAVFG